MTDEGDLADYLGVKIQRLSNGTIKLSQPHLIEQILEDLGFKGNTMERETPALSTVKLNQDVEGVPMQEEWDYRSIVGKLNFLEKSTRCDLSYAVHQCARFSSDPKQSHAEAVKRIGRYLLKTRNKGLILNPSGFGFDCFVDANFPSFEREGLLTTELDPSSAKSRAGYQVLLGRCPMVWSSKLIKEVCLSTMEAEYAALTKALKDVKFLQQLMEESRDMMNWRVPSEFPKVHCKAFKDDVTNLVGDHHCHDF